MTRERASHGGAFWYLTTNPSGTRIRAERGFDYRHSLEDKLWEIGNYFVTKEEAEAYALRIREFLPRCEKIS